ncbi:MAG: ABC transporter permease [Spirochaetaceae bacterium]|nr:MAG: ABC transporter permease [Spirochaetaceae bacterium]
MNGIFNRLRWLLLVSGRHIQSRRESDGNTASRLSVLGIAAGVAALVMILSIMNGFQLGTIEAMLEVNSYHLRVYDTQWPENDGDAEALTGLPGVISAVPVADLEGIVHGFFGTTRGVAFRGLPVDVFDRDPGFEQTVQSVAGRLDFARPGTVILGEELRRALGVRVGDTIPVITLGESQRGGRLPREASLEVTGSFRTGFYEYDLSLAIISLDTASELFSVGREDQFIGIKLSDRFSDLRVREQIAILPGGQDMHDVRSWREYNRAMFSALRTEKLIMTLLLGLIFVVVGANIYQSLRRSVHERADEIAILKGMGAAPLDVQAVFVIEGFVIGTIGSAAGLVIGLLGANEVNRLVGVFESFVAGALSVLDAAFGLAAPSGGAVSSTMFFLRDVPVELFFREVFGIVFFAIIASVSAAWFASLRASRIRPADVLRDE